MRKITTLTFLGICHRLQPPRLGCGVVAEFLALFVLPLHVFSPDKIHSHTENQIHLITAIKAG